MYDSFLLGAGQTLAFVSWDHPNMPWDDTTLSVGTFGADGAVVAVRIVCGDEQPQAVMVPASPANPLCLSSLSLSVPLRVSVCVSLRCTDDGLF